MSRFKWERSRLKWEIDYEQADSPDLKLRLQAGWEPFAVEPVNPSRDGTKGWEPAIIWIRRSKTIEPCRHSGCILHFGHGGKCVPEPMKED